MADQLRFDNRVAIVTGAGGGLGRQYAILLASRGASVVVNDLGGTRSGETNLQGVASSAADRVVQEIRANGGKAVANYNSVEQGDAIVKTAIDNFGRVDIVINNAGILRDRSLLKMTDEDWDLIQQVHLRGSFMVSRAAWPYMRDQKYGRIIMTSSSAGLYGNFGQTNYSAAKMGLVGLSNTLAVEGLKYNIRCNVIVPVAASRLTEDVIPEHLFNKLQPECVAPVVAWLTHESCPETGGIFEAAGGWVGRYKLHRSQGKVYPSSKMTPECVRNDWNEITSMDNAKYLTTITEQFGSLLESLQQASDQQRQAAASQQDTSGHEYGGAAQMQLSGHVDADKTLLDSIPTSGLKCDILFKIISDRMHQEPELTEQLKAIFQFNITQGGKIVATWTTDTKIDTAVYRSEPKNNVKPDCSVTVDDEDFISLMVGKLNPQRAFMMGKLNIKGNVLLLQKLNTMWVQLQLHGKAPELDLLASAVLNYKIMPGYRCDAMIIEMFLRMARVPQLVTGIKYIFRMHILKDNQEVAVYTINLKEDQPAFYRGAGQSDTASDCEFYLEDDDLVRLMYRKLDLKEAVQSNRIRVEGSKEIALKLEKLFTTMQSAVSKL